MTLELRPLQHFVLARFPAPKTAGFDFCAHVDELDAMKKMRMRTGLEPRDYGRLVPLIVASNANHPLLFLVLHQNVDGRIGARPDAFIAQAEKGALEMTGAPASSEEARSISLLDRQDAGIAADEASAREYCHDLQ